jgi:hypothetical protein
MMAAPSQSLNLDSIIDAEFETVLPASRAGPAQLRAAPEYPVPDVSADGLELLRGNGPALAKNEQPEQLTPTFLFFTAVAAFAVFWVSGGHALLY